MAEAEVRHAHHFTTLEQQRSAARLGMWVFLSSESLLFAALFGLYAAYRSEYHAAFDEGMRHMAHGLGALNTAVLLTSSLAAALALDALERGASRLALALTAVTAAMGVGFLAVKGFEYAAHVREGMVPGRHTHFFVQHPVPGLPIFVTLYFLMTGLHAVHVTAGVLVLAWLGLSVLRGHVTPRSAVPFELGVLYWHLVDALWVFLWPMFYFAPGGP